jgi:hypothetical protein
MPHGDAENTPLYKFIEPTTGEHCYAGIGAAPSAEGVDARHQMQVHYADLQELRRFNCIMQI